MFNELISQITPLIQHYGAWGVFFISAIEEIIVPIPSSFSLLAAGFFLVPVGAALGDSMLVLILKVVIPAGLGFAIGSLFPYALAYLGGEPIINRWGKWIGVSWKDVEKINRFFNGTYKDELVLVGLRSIPVVPSGLISVACGVVRYPIKHFFLTTFFGSALRSFFMGLLGWSLGEAFVIYADQISEFGMYVVYIVTGLVAILVVAFLVRKWLKKHRHKAH
ncbi:MAG: VTT domain-containing protein [bacterium]|nr:VTT domain-containing protein [Candidatus Jorgensenbacteria bacterium]